MELIVDVRSNINDSFVLVPKEVVESYLIHTATSPILMKQFCPIRISSDEDKNLNIYAAALLTSFSDNDGSTSKILKIGPQFASDIGLKHGGVVRISSCVQNKQWKVAKKLEIVPLNANESEVIELNAMAFQNSLIQTLRVVFPEQEITLSIPSGASARVKVASSKVMEPSGSPSYVLTTGTELYVALQVRNSVAPKEPLATILRVLPTHFLPENVVSELRRRRRSLDDDRQRRWSIFVAKALQEGLHWKPGLRIGVFNIGHLAWETGDDEVSPSEISVEWKGLLTSDFIKRHTSIGCVELIDSQLLGEITIACSSITMNTQHGSHWCIIVPPEHKGIIYDTFPHGPITLFAKPSPEDQYGRNDVNVIIGNIHPGAKETAPSFHIGVDREEILSLSEVSDVHGKVIMDLLLRLSPRRADTWGLTRSFPHNILLCGPSGCGKTTIASSIGMASGRHVVLVDCSTSKSKLKVIMNNALSQCIFSSPAVLILDNYDAIASSGSDSQTNQPTTISTGTEFMIHDWIKAACVRYQPMSDIMILATARSFDEIHTCLKLPSLFSYVEKIVPGLSYNTKVELIRQTTLRSGMFSESECDVVSRQLADLVDNYSVTDIVNVSSRVVRQLVHAHGELRGKHPSNTQEHLNNFERDARDIIMPVVSSFIPTSRSGIRFLGGGSNKTWEDIGGMAEAKAALRDVLVLPSKYPHIFKNLPLKSKSGVLLHGPSGCGKTYILSTVVAAEGLHCIVVNGPEVFGKYIGTSEQKIREIFESAQAAAPCVVFFDEFDSVAPRRGNSNTGVTDRVVNQLLCYLDGVESRKDVYVVAASSRPELIDPALLRPGRLDISVLCPMPSSDDRVEVISSHLRKCSSDNRISLSKADLETLAKKTESWTCADLSGLVSTAHTQLVQNFLELTSGDLLGQCLNVSEEHEDSAFSIFCGKADSDTLTKQKESIRRSGLANRTSGPTFTNLVSSIPPLQLCDIEAAMVTFKRSRESQNQERAGEMSGKLAKLKEIGVRQTSI